jgi:hypothetical protein
MIHPSHVTEEDPQVHEPWPNAHTNPRDFSAGRIQEVLNLRTATGEIQEKANQGRFSFSGDGRDHDTLSDRMIL